MNNNKLIKKFKQIMNYNKFNKIFYSNKKQSNNKKQRKNMISGKK